VECSPRVKTIGLFLGLTECEVENQNQQSAANLTDFGTAEDWLNVAFSIDALFRSGQPIYQRTGSAIDARQWCLLFEARHGKGRGKCDEIKFLSRTKNLKCEVQFHCSRNQTHADVFTKPKFLHSNA